MLVYVRHGATALNKGGHEERLRGWLPVPLSDVGHDQIHTTAHRLATILSHDVNSFVTSDLLRAVQSAHILSHALGIPATPDAHIRDWNTGSLAGQTVDDALPTLKKLVANPDDPAPEGESLNTFLDRFVPAMRQRVISPGVHLVVGHARGATILEGIADEDGGKGGEISPKFLLDRPRVQPGGVLIVNTHWDTTVDNPAETS